MAYMTESRWLSLSIDGRFACMDWLYDQEAAANGPTHGTSFRVLTVCRTATTTSSRKVDFVTLLQVNSYRGGERCIQGSGG